jgi:glycosyltransferase involved in cell wall biosynthesis
MRTLQLIDHMGSGGAQTIVYDLARLLPGHGIDVEVAHLFAPNVFSEQLAALETPVHDLSTGARYAPAAALDPRPVQRLRRLLRDQRYDVVNLHLYIAPLHARLAGVARRSGCVVNTVHAHRAELPGYVFPSYRATRSVTDLFIGDFDCSRGELEDVGIAPDQIEVIPFGVDPVDPMPRFEARRTLDLDADAFVVLSVARLHAQRFIDRFVAAFDLLLQRRPNSVLLLAGDGDERAALESVVEQRGLQSQVRFLGRRSDLDLLFGAADAYVSVSRDGDVGVAALQAMSAGLPCIAWDNAGLERSFAQLEGSMTVATAATDVAFAERLVAVSTPDARAEHGDRVRSIVRARHSAPAMAAAYADSYRRYSGQSPSNR